MFGAIFFFFFLQQDDPMTPKRIVFVVKSAFSNMARGKFAQEQKKFQHQVK